YFCDTGLACFAQSISSPEALSGHPLLGAIFETAVLGEIRKLASLLATKPNFYHWRASSGAEVDLILERDGKFFPIEIKATHQPKVSAAYLQKLRKSALLMPPIGLISAEEQSYLVK
ncbi:MAG: hypothetical protein UW70_C0105G0007, partial [Candidatus Peregrinibacteria bacterium GW2011_GWA2_44_7]